MIEVIKGIVSSSRVSVFECLGDCAKCQTEKPLARSQCARQLKKVAQDFNPQRITQ